MILKKIILLILLFLSLLASGQKTELKGLVTDTENEPLAFATIFVEGTTIGVVSDLEGRFYINYNGNPLDKIIISSLGFTSDTFLLEELLQEDLHIILRASAIFLNEVVVKGRNVNPSFLAMDSIWSNKAKNANSDMLNYYCNMYSKVELDLYNINRDRFGDSKLLNKLNFVLDFIDSTSSTPYLPLFLTENVSEYYWIKSPLLTYNKEIATKISGVNNENLNPILGKLYQSVNVYENFINILDKTFVSPLSDNGHNYYKYYIMDSTDIDEEKRYKMEFYPKRKQENTFTGLFWYSAKEFAVVALDMEISEGANINFVKKVKMSQEFQKQGKYFMLRKDALIVHFQPAKNSIDLIGRKTDYYKDFKINSPLVKSLIQEDKLRKENPVSEKSDEDWEGLRHEKLNRNEAFIYHMVDTLMTVPRFKSYVGLITVLSTGYKSFGPIDIGPYYSMVSYDSIETWRFRAGFRTNKKFSKRVRFSAYSAYGLADKKFKYQGKIEYRISKYPWRKLTFSYLNDFDMENESTEIDDDNFFAMLVQKDLPQLHIYVIKKNLKYDFQWSDHLSSTIYMNQQSYAPFFHFNYAIDEVSKSAFSNTEMGMVFRFAYNEKKFRTYYTMTSLGTKFPVFQVTYSKGLQGVINGEFNYEKIELSIKDMFPVYTIGKTRYEIKSGLIKGDVPYLLLFIPKGNNTYYMKRNAFNSMNPYEFVSDQYASLDIEHHFDGLILNKLPLLKKLKWRSFVGYKGFSGSLSSENKRKLDGQIPIAMDGKIYSELSTGIENIFKVLRFDVVWRFSEVNNPKFKTHAFAVYGALQFKF